MNEYVLKYKNLCLLLHSEATTNKEIKRNNRILKEILNLEKEIEHLKDKEFMIDLINDSDLRVSTNAAAFCVRDKNYTQEAFSLLHSIDLRMGRCSPTVRSIVFHVLFEYRQEYEEYLNEMKKK